MTNIGAVHGRALLAYSLNNPTETYEVGLYTTNPTKDNIGTEASGGIYERQAITFSEPAEGDDDKQYAVNDAAVDFGRQTTALGTITHWAVFGSVRGFLYFDNFDVSQAVAAGNSFKIEAGDIKIKIS